MPRTRVQRVVGASIGLLLTGALVGAGVGAGVLAGWGLLADGPGGFPYDWFAFEFAAVVGAVLGGVLLPLATWIGLPHVAFGRILVETAVGTAVGAAIAIFVAGVTDPLDVVLGAGLGFVASVVQLRLRRRQTSHLEVPTHDAT